MAVEGSRRSLATVIPSSSPTPGHPDRRKELGEEGVTKGVFQAQEQMELATVGRWEATLDKQRPCDLEGPFAPLSLNFLNYQKGTHLLE